MTCLKDSVVEKPYNVISLDTEADKNGETYVYCVAGHYGKKEINRAFDSRAKCVKFLFQRKWHNTILTGLNLAFDLNTLYGKRDGFKWDSIYNMGRLITSTPGPEEMKKYNFKKSSEYLKIIDLGNFIQGMSLKQMADTFKIGGHIDKHILGVDGNKQEMTEACLSHCWTGVKIFDEIQRKIHDLGGMIKLTGPATSLDLFRRKYLTEENQIFDFLHGAETETQKTEREKRVTYMKKIGKAAYVGGRTEAFKLGLFNNVDYLDINSSYPAQMSKRTYPNMNTYKRYTKGLTLDFLKGLIAEEEGQAFITIQTPKKLLIPFLHGSTNSGKLIFPSGTLSRWYTFPEIEYALKLGYKIKEIIEIASFKRMETPFKQYVSDMMAYKTKCKPVAKLLANGLSGKFGQKKPDESTWEIVDYSEDIEIDYKEYFSINGQIWRYNRVETPGPEEDIFMRYSYPLIIAYITAWGRIQEHQTIMSIGPEKVYYMDTDSIIADHKAVQAAIKKGLIEVDPKKLGAYDLEHINATIDIRGEKYYRIHDTGNPWTYHIKGVPGYVMQQHWLHHISVYYRPRKIKTALRSGKQVNEFIRISHRDVTKPEKRIWLKHGRESLPLKVDESF